MFKVIPEPLKEAVENVSTPLERNVKDERLNSSTVHDQDAVEVATAMAAMADSVAKGTWNVRDATFRNKSRQ